MNTKTLIMALAGLAVLAGCAEKTQVLPGAREDLRPVAEPVVNSAPAISLPAQTRNANWTHRIGSPTHRTANAALSAAPVRLWSASIGKGEGRKARITADPVVADGRIFTVDAEATVTATSLNGETLWTRDMTAPRDKPDQAASRGLAYDNGRLFVTSGFGRLHAIDPTSGQDFWVQKLDAVGSGSPAVYGDLVYVVSGDATAWAIEAATGKVAWQLVSVPDVQRVQSPSAPAINDRLAVFAYGSGDLQAVFRRGGVRRWNAGVSDTRPGRAINTVGDISADPVISGNTVYVANHSGRMAALELDTGSRRWTAEEGALSPVFPAGNSIFLVSDRNELIRMNASDGTKIWGQELPYFVKDKPKKQAEVHAHYGPILAGSQLIVPSSDDTLRIYNPQSGALVHSTELPDGAATNPVVAGGVLYIVSRKGELHAFR